MIKHGALLCEWTWSKGVSCMGLPSSNLGDPGHIFSSKLLYTPTGSCDTEDQYSQTPTILFPCADLTYNDTRMGPEPFFLEETYYIGRWVSRWVLWYLPLPEDKILPYNLPYYHSQLTNSQVGFLNECDPQDHLERSWVKVRSSVRS